MLFSCFFSSLIYWLLYKKAKIHIKYFFIDNVLVFSVSFILSYYIWGSTIFALLINFLLILLFICSFTMFRFWRAPNRRNIAKKNEIVSPADGNIIYIRKIDAHRIPVLIKNKLLSRLSELTKTELLEAPCWIIGINMTLFDVHKNAAPIGGEILLNMHVNGKFLSLKNAESEVANERNTYVIRNEVMQVGVVQIASKRVKRIDSYVKEGKRVEKGDWLGMIRFGSQVDLIIPDHCKVKVNLGQQVYAIKTIIAEF